MYYFAYLLPYPWPRLDTTFTHISRDNMVLPRTSQNLFLHILCNHYAVIFTKAENQQPPSAWDLCLFDYDLKGRILVLAVSQASAVPGALIDTIVCGCVVKRKACSMQSMHDGKHLYVERYATIGKNLKEEQESEFKDESLEWSYL